MLPFYLCYVGPIDRFNLRGLLDEAVEKFATGARGPAVEAECELIQVVVQMIATDSPMMGTERPPLQQRDYQMNSRQEFTRRFFVPAKKGNLMRVALLSQPVIPEPSIGVNNATGFDGVFDEFSQTVSRCIWNPSHANAADTPAFLLSSNHNQ